MDVWSRGRPHASCAGALQTNLTLDAPDFDLTFLDSKEDLQHQQPKPEQQFAGVDSASATNASGKNAAPCKVCGDKASGYHYGVTSCEGCKGFFRRSIQKQIEYRCLRDGKCLVIRLNRNRCQFCRFKKCLTVGMSRDSVRYGRVPKRSRESQSEPEPSSMQTSTAVSETATEETNRAGVAREIARAVIAAHRANNTYTDELKRMLQHQDYSTARLEPETDSLEEASSSTDSAPTERRAALWSSMGQRLAGDVQQVVEFAKRLPGFFSLPQDDQLILIKLGFFEVWLTKAARLATADCLVFDDGTLMYQYQVETAYGDAEFAKSLFSYMRSVCKLQLSEEESALLCGALLLCPQRPGLTDLARVTTLHEAMLESFSYYVTSTASSNGNSASSAAAATAAVLKRVEAATQVLAEAQAVSTRHNILMEWCREPATAALLALPPLFSEIFDIPKNEEQVQEERSPTHMMPPQVDSTLLNV